MSEPDKVALFVDSDSGDFIEGDARVIGVVGIVDQLCLYSGHNKTKENG